MSSFHGESWPVQREETQDGNDEFRCEQRQLDAAEDNFQSEHVVLPEEKVQCCQGAGYHEQDSQEEGDASLRQIAQSAEVHAASFRSYEEGQEGKLDEGCASARRRQIRHFERAHPYLADGEHAEIKRVEVHEDLVR